jgi:hypothetical protein
MDLDVGAAARELSLYHTHILLSHTLCLSNALSHTLSSPPTHTLSPHTVVLGFYPLRPQNSTLDNQRQLYTLHLNANHFTLNSTSETSNLQPETRNSKPETRNPTRLTPQHRGD